MSDVVQFDPRTRLLKLTNSRNILLILGILQVGMHAVVLYTLPGGVEREPDFPESIVWEYMTTLVPAGQVRDTRTYFRQMEEKEPEKYKELYEKAREELKIERETMRAVLLERAPIVSWSGVACGTFTLFAALLLPWMAGGLSVLAALAFLGFMGVQLYQFGAGGLLNGIVFYIVAMVMYFYASRLALEAETGIRVK